MDSFKPLNKKEITHSQLVKYAGASGDFNPIHTVTPIAEQAGLGGVIAHGMLIMGFAGQAITQWFPLKHVKELNVRFTAITRPGESITIFGKQIEEQQVEGKTYLIGEVIAKNEEGEMKLKGQFKVEK
ncbi:MaoC/PaaZ C-terminal domain-containing protein [Anaerobacillus sp. MEB173]|uniref:MaoC/PaaZ C-terminal domain-containing protein n=1 Tax=Anaerobacillus sp. MEB173 TaxID=3383345 RepID=UPI003F93C95F